MRTLQLTAFIYLILCILLIEAATAIKCHQCKACNDPFEKSSKSDRGMFSFKDNGRHTFSDQEVYCTGSCIKGKALADHKETEVKKGDVLRGCFDEIKLKEGCRTEEVEAGYKVEVCFCNQNLCNGSSGFPVSMASVTTATFITILKNIL